MRRRVPARIALATVAAVALAAPVPAPAQPHETAPARTELAAAKPPPAERPAPKTSLYEIEKQVMCVVCETPLSVADGPQAEEERALIRRLVREGKTADEIKAALVAEYGTRVLALPEEEGFNLAVYLVPVAVVLAAAALVAVLLPRWRRARTAAARAAAAPDSPPELSAEDARRLEEDLRRYDA